MIAHAAAKLRTGDGAEIAIREPDRNKQVIRDLARARLVSRGMSLNFARRYSAFAFGLIGLALFAPTGHGATLVVTNNGDAGPGSLRQALADSADGDVIDATGLSGTITLTTGTLSVIHAVTINGPGAANLTIDGNYPAANNSVIIVSRTGPVVLEGMTVTNGLNYGGGGGINNDHSQLTVSHCRIMANGALNGFGGGVYNNAESGSATLALLESTVSNNFGDEGGGIMNDGYNGNAIMTISGSTVNGNGAQVNGGGIYNNSYSGAASLTIVNSTISDNGCSYNGGGLIVNEPATVTVENSTIAGNSSGSSGGGATIWAETVTFANTIVAGNTSMDGPDISGTITSTGYNLIGDTTGSAGWSLNDLLNLDPRLGPLADNGGPTLTRALNAGSPALDAGDPTFDPNNFVPPRPFDQRGAGHNRVLLGRIDIGAHESEQTPTPTPTPTPSPTPTPTVTPTVTPTPTATATPTPSPSATATPTVTPTATPQPTSTPSPTVAPPVVLQNISTRLSVGTGDNVLISGFILTGTAPKTLLLRAIGPSLAQASPPVEGALADPVLELHKPDGSVVTNDNWRDTQGAQINQSGLAPTNELESALIVTLDPNDPTPNSGAYTVVVHGQNDTTGAAVVEIYDLDSSSASRLVNTSSRGVVDIGDKVMIAGLTVATPGRVLVRALGAELAAAGVSGTLADPTLDLYNQDGIVIDSNDDWENSPEANQIAVTGLPPTESHESAILRQLSPGAYTAVVRGKDGASGVALVEVYNLSP